jgi:hypothetical protein
LNMLSRFTAGIAEKVTRAVWRRRNFAREGNYNKRIG